MIENNEIEHLAKLSRISLSNEDIELHKQKLENFFKYVEELKAVDTSGVKPLSHAVPDNYLAAGDMCNVFREDVVSQDRIINREELLSQAPKSNDGMFEVPQILEN